MGIFCKISGILKSCSLRMVCAFRENELLISESGETCWCFVWFELALLLTCATKDQHRY